MIPVCIFFSWLIRGKGPTYHRGIATYFHKGTKLWLVYIVWGKLKDLQALDYSYVRKIS